MTAENDDCPGILEALEEIVQLSMTEICGQQAPTEEGKRNLSNDDTFAG